MTLIALIDSIVAENSIGLNHKVPQLCATAQRFRDDGC